jgi:hypothetical protein
LKAPLHLALKIVAEEPREEGNLPPSTHLPSWLTSINPFAILADLKEVLVISKLPTTQDAIISSAVQWVFVLDAFAVFHGQTEGKEVPG